MPDFDWQGFLTSRGVAFVTRGTAVTRGNIAVRCPFCRDDPSFHLAISLHGKGWRCFRRKEHAGRSDARLVATLIGCSMDMAHSIVGTRRHLTGDVLATVKGLLDAPKTDTREARSIDMPDEFRRFTGRELGLERPFVEYMRKRGFYDVQKVAKTYGLRYATRGPFRYRIVFPIVFDGRLVNWTARAIGDDPLRYKTLSTDPDKVSDGQPLAVGPISDYLLWYDDLQDVDADTIVVCEGPFDALKINYLGRREGVCATCWFTMSPGRTQIDLLHTLLPRFRYRYLIQDQGAMAAGMRTTADLSALKLESIQLPRGVKDPGELSSHDFHALFA